MSHRWRARLRVAVAALIPLLSCASLVGCGRHGPGDAPPPIVSPADVAPPSPRAEAALLALALGEDRAATYLGMSALVGWYRALGRGDAADALFAERLKTLDDEGLRPLILLWYGDQALYDGRPGDAVRRYDQAQAAAGDRAFVGRLLITEILTQRALAHHLAGDAEAAEEDLLSAARGAESVRASSLIQRAADFAWADGARGHSRDLRRAADELAAGFDRQQAVGLPSQREGGADRQVAWRVPPLTSLDLRAPWQAGVAQRAGGIGPGFGAWAGYVGRVFTRGRRGDACGRGFTGYYYARGSHREGWQGGRDRYAIDFTHGHEQGSRFGNDSFGLQVRATAQGIVSYAYYGTQTFWNGWDAGPAPSANRVNVLHFLGASSLLDATLAELDEPWNVYPLQGLQSWSLHMVGLKEPCDPSTGLCVAFPGQVSFGQFVWQGSPLGYEDSTGLSAMSHLHYSLMVPCTARDRRCARDDPRLRHVSVPVVMEGDELGDDDTGRCVVSTNTWQLGGEGAPGDLPAPVRALLRER